MKTIIWECNTCCDAENCGYFPCLYSNPLIGNVKNAPKLLCPISGEKAEWEPRAAKTVRRSTARTTYTLREIAEDLEYLRKTMFACKVDVPQISKQLIKIIRQLRNA